MIVSVEKYILLDLFSDQVAFYLWAWKIVTYTIHLGDKFDSVKVYCASNNNHVLDVIYVRCRCSPR